MPDTWEIKNDSTSSHKGNALNVLTIVQQVSSDTPPVVTGYDLMHGSTLLKSYPSSMEPVRFKDVHFAGRKWDITAMLPFIASGPLPGKGKWKIKKEDSTFDDTADDNGEFTAQAGTGMEEPKAASSAKV